MTVDPRTQRDGLVLVTGINGFVGREVASALEASGWRIRGTSRRPRAADFGGVDIARVPDLLDRVAVAAAMRDVRHVVHAAGHAHVLTSTQPGDAAEFHRVNVAGTRVVLEEAAAAGVRGFVFISSAAAASAGVTLLSDRSQGEPDGAYGWSKRAAEELVLRLGAAVGMSAAVVRPPMIYGPGMRGNPLRLLRLVERGVPLPLAWVRNRRSVLFSGNLAAFICSLLELQPAPCEPFHIADVEPVSTPELVEMMAAALGTHVRLFPVPLPILRFAARCARLPTRGRVHAGTIDRLVDSLVVCDGRLDPLLGFRPPFTTAEGIRRTVATYRSAANSRAARPHEARVAV